MDNEEIKATDPATRRGLIIMGVVIALVVLVSLFVGLIFYVANHPKQSKPVVARTVDPAKREQHRAYLEELQQKGIFAKIDDQGGAHNFVDVWTGPRFYEATFEQKEIFVGSVWSYYFGDTDKRDGSGVRVFDNYSGKQIGEYSMWNGGLKLY
jgi:hypothetical protein